LIIVVNYLIIEIDYYDGIIAIDANYVCMNVCMYECMYIIYDYLIMPSPFTAHSTAADSIMGVTMFRDVAPEGFGLFDRALGSMFRLTAGITFPAIVFS
jgi:hypothetical protein